MNKQLNVGLLQARCLNTLDENLNNIKNIIRKNKDKNLDLLVLPELHNGPYFCQNQTAQQFDRGETIPGNSTEILSTIAKDNNMVIVASIFEKALKGLYYNTAVVIDKDGSIAGKYRKMHIPHDPEYNEKYYFTPGDLGFEPIDTSIGKLGVLVCWDQWFPEAARLMALQGAEIIVYPTAIGWDPNDSGIEQQKQVESWQIVQRSHAIANNVFVVSCNRTGLEHEEYSINTKTKAIDFWGHSFIAGPQGEFLANCKTQENMIISAAIDLNSIEQVRRVWPFFRDRRTDAYGKLISENGVRPKS